jgi:hypothetical protein
MVASVIPPPMYSFERCLGGEKGCCLKSWGNSVSKIEAIALREGLHDAIYHDFQPSLTNAVYGLGS